MPNLGNYDTIDMLMLQPVYITMFLLPIAFPMIWVLVRAYGNARIVALFSHLTNKANASKYLHLTAANKNNHIPVPFGMRKVVITIYSTIGKAFCGTISEHTESQQCHARHYDHGFRDCVELHW